MSHFAFICRLLPLQIELICLVKKVVAHERVVDAISIVLGPKEDHNLYFSHQLIQYIMSGQVIDGGELFQAKVPRTRGLNIRQHEALEKSVSNTLSLVHGPPGTGER